MEYFVVTQDRDTAITMTNEGFQLIQRDGDTYVFLNNQQLDTSNFDKKKLVYTDHYFL